MPSRPTASKFLPIPYHGELLRNCSCTVAVHTTPRPWVELERHHLKAANSGNQMMVEGRAAVASEYALLLTATTERGPPDQLKTCPRLLQNMRAKRTSYAMKQQQPPQQHSLQSGIIRAIS